MLVIILYKINNVNSLTRKYSNTNLRIMIFAKKNNYVHEKQKYSVYP